MLKTTFSLNAIFTDPRDYGFNYTGENKGDPPAPGRR